MEDLQKINISALPGFPAISRKMAVIGKNEDYENRTVTLVLKPEHYDASGNRLNAFKALEEKPFLLVATDTSYVNPESGALVFPDGSGNMPHGSIPQYTFLKNAMENGANIMALIEYAVTEADNLGRFT